MGLLSSLLPGLRDLRAPLAAGYLWLAALWLEFGSRIDLEERGKPTAFASSSAYRAWLHLQRPGQAVVTSFVAYLIGAGMSEIYPTTFLRRRGRVGRPVSTEAFSGLESWLDEWRLAHEDAWLLLTKPDKRREPVFDLDEPTPTTNADPESVEGKRAAWRVERETYDRVIDLLRELDTLRTQLLRNEPILAEELDRRHAEGEFRRAVGPPLLVVLAIAASRLGLTWWQALTVFASALALQLFISGGQRERLANNDLIRLMTNDGLISWPRLDEAVRRAEGPTRDASIPRGSMPNRRRPAKP